MIRRLIFTIILIALMTLTIFYAFKYRKLKIDYLSQEAYYQERYDEILLEKKGFKDDLNQILKTKKALEKEIKDVKEELELTNKELNKALGDAKRLAENFFLAESEREAKENILPGLVL